MLNNVWTNVVFFNVDLNNVRQCQKNVIFNVNFYNVGQRRNSVVNMTNVKKKKQKLSLELKTK